MASPAPEPRAPHTCNTCRTRKKACDKRMPTCGYCGKRGLLCSYEVESSASTGSVGAWNPGLDQILAPLQSPTEGEQVERIIQSLSLSSFEVSERFFRSFHLWFPVISPRLFYTCGTSSPPSDLSILLLAMCLITQHPADDRIYTTLRILFAQVQAAVCASTPLVQAGILISAYEYARGWLDAAYISIGMCARMACTIGIDESLRDKLDWRPWSRTKLHENRNIWWGVVVLERVILSESAHRNLRPASDFPSEDSFLPSDLNHLETEQRRKSSSHLEPWATTVLSDMDSTNVSSFGRLVQAAYLLDRFVKYSHNAATAEANLTDLTNLDRALQDFLILLMHESEAIPTPHSGAITLAVRALFLLHQEILSLSIKTTKEEDIKVSSQAALDTAAKMVIDAAHDHIKDMKIVHAFPLCCARNIRDARIQIGAMECSDGNGTFNNGLNVLIGLEKTFCAQWRPNGEL